ncbi:hypothetical protein [Streptomyces aidingensis]|uniref:Uncharacterized protein n=1 Tax=Streptomyces aidingensis TaxID=910347 RepID=A0A1I1H334_9ACTN|nr:hypothetical protein [Streptomyces aidingensis]SFC18334.1 hypothetical protein SAMN05421773_102233 [Streptomyces aidingensis]
MATALQYTPVTREEVRTDLGRFLTLFTELEDRDGVMPMFSAAIDAEWHRLLDDPDAYGRFCDRHTGGARIGHRPLTGQGTVEWVPAYQERYGTLPPAWFADAAGTVDAAAYGAYLRTGTVVTGWDCSPIEGGDDTDTDDDGAAPRPSVRR